MAAIQALESLKRPCRVSLTTDSQYVQKGILEWMSGWKRRGWKTAAKKPVKNVDLWKRLAPMLTEILGFDCATNRKHGYQNAMLTYPSFSPTSGLDKIFCRGLKALRGKRCRLRMAKVASDHLPVYADLEL